MESQAARLLRLRLHPDGFAAWDAPDAAHAARGTPRFLGQINTAGTLPTSANRVYLVNPVRLDGEEREGAALTFSVDGSRTIPVIVIGSKVPRVGDLVVAVSVGGRWLAQMAGGVTLMTNCLPCPYPQKDLTISWTNPVLGNGSAPLRMTSPSWWTSPCNGRLLFTLACYGGATQLTASYFLSGECPGGQQQICSSPGNSPSQLNLSHSTCNPLFVTFSITEATCPVLAFAGFSSLTITE
jgi:hypothetical protein